MANIAPHPLPEMYRADGYDRLVSEEFGCEAQWVVDYETTVSTSSGWVTYFVHEFALSGHRKSDACFVIRARKQGGGPVVTAY